MMEDDQRKRVIAAIVEGKSIRAVASEFGLTKGAVEKVSKQIRWAEDGSLDVSASAMPPRRKALAQSRQVFNLGESIRDYVEAGLGTLTAQAKHMGDKKWLANQSAGELSAAHGVLADKMLRIASAIQQEINKQDVQTKIGVDDAQKDGTDEPVDKIPEF